ncbi:unnamed protein product [Nippostrongylus brasiliensis]|uniref:GATA zinc finger domain-containing protein 14-like n=1 Tax=Nippostrongylus brasiliensis TaxID=27835 RepID=A0A0N4XKM7_NIPBR|nr:unnamed protein product [Nippostrongylus brasiliensis]
MVGSKIQGPYARLSRPGEGRRRDEHTAPDLVSFSLEGSSTTPPLLSSQVLYIPLYGRLTWNLSRPGGLRHKPRSAAEISDEALKSKVKGRATSRPMCLSYRWKELGWWRVNDGDHDDVDDDDNNNNNNNNNNDNNNSDVDNNDSNDVDNNDNNDVDNNDNNDDNDDNDDELREQELGVSYLQLFT